jgi:hypothetical protein
MVKIGGAPFNNHCHRLNTLESLSLQLVDLFGPWECGDGDCLLSALCVTMGNPLDAQHVVNFTVSPCLH